MDSRQILEQVRSNQQQLEKFQQMELRLLEATSLSELVKVLVEDYPREFALDAVGLTLFDWNGELNEFMSDKTELPPGVAISAVQEAVRQVYFSAGGIRLGAYDPKSHAQFFPGRQLNSGSVALLKLARQEHDIGLLALGSRNEYRYEQKLGTTFLSRLAIVTAVCIENALNLERVRQLGYRDPLTRLYNRRFFNERLTQEIARARRGAYPVCFIYMDVDYFKKVNDVHGHAAGDQVLCEVARRIRTQLRLGELLARIGGEEFAIVLADTPLKEAARVAERIRTAMLERYFKLPKDAKQGVTISAGVAELRPTAFSSLEGLGDRLLDSADAALLIAKESGRNQVRCAGGGESD